MCVCACACVLAFISYCHMSKPATLLRSCYILWFHLVEPFFLIPFLPAEWSERLTPGQSGWLGAAAVGSIPALALSLFLQRLTFLQRIIFLVFVCLLLMEFFFGQVCLRLALEVPVQYPVDRFGIHLTTVSRTFNFLSHHFFH